LDRVIVLLLKCLIGLRYRVRLQGVEAIKAKGDKGILFLPNHPALIEPVILTLYLYPLFKVRVLGDEEQLDRPVVSFLTRRIRALRLPSLVQSGVGVAQRVQAIIERCVEALRAEDSLLLYPAGRVYRSRHEQIGANSAVERIVEELPDVRVVLVRSTGFWGSGFSWASGKRPLVIPVLKDGFKSLLLNGLFFGPRREVTIALVEPEDLPRTGGRQAINPYLEAFYNQDAPVARYVPYTWWEKGGGRDYSEREADTTGAEDVEISPLLRKQVLDFLRECTGVEEIKEEMSLTRDLHMDSLAGAELVTWLETEYGYAEIPIDALQTVRDVMLAARGEAVSAGEDDIYEAPKRWCRKKPAVRRPNNYTDMTIPAAFLFHARFQPDKVAIADNQSGALTYRQMVLAIGLLKREFAALPGRYVGIMLPASAGVAIIYLATLFAGKIPVMVNWTLGKRNLLHALDSLDVKHVVTARALLTKLSGQGIDLGEILDRFVCVEDVRTRFSVGDKLKAKLASYGSWSNLKQAEIPETAAMLFTSGSENVPKAVPLTHRNILTNVGDAVDCLTLTEH
ncbi:MAG: AMP-binding protein, partial [Bacteroidales bacterium]|nr:AMP-binding protein [Bacteroidales bacterium]